MLSMVTAGVTGVGTFLIKHRSDRKKWEEYINMPRGSKNEDNQFPIEKAGHPHPENLPDNEMVSEGAQFGVQYYNHLKNAEKVK